MDKFIDFFIKNTRLNYVLLLFIIIGGIYSYKIMPKEIFPPIALDEISITGEYLGASANILNKMAVKSIEDEINNISGIYKITSHVSSNHFEIIASINENEDKSAILQEVKDGISRIKDNLPKDMNEPIASSVVAKFPLILINISSLNKSNEFMIDIAKELKSSLSNIKDLSDINIYGEGDKQVQISINSGILKAYDINPSSVLRQISAMSSIFPIGKIDQKNDKNYFISTFNGAKTVDEFLQTTLNIDGKILKLNQIASVEKIYKNDTTISSFNGKKTISINLSKSKNGNAIMLSKKIKSIVENFAKKYPEVTFGTFSDTSIYIKNRLNTVISNILFGLILVGFTMYLLINKRISFIVVIGIPTSFVISLIIFHLNGYSINMMSLLGALIALGIIVDDAIIVSENIQRYIELGYEIKDACIIGTKEVLKPILASSLTTVFAFLPMLILTGELGMFIRVIPISITILILSSVIESFIFLPLHAKHTLKKDERKVNWTWFLNLYELVLNFLINYKKISLLIFYILTPLLIYGGYKSTQFKLISSFDGEQMNISASLATNTNLEESFKIASIIEKYLLENKDKYFIQNITTMAGLRVSPSGDDTRLGDNLFHIFIDLQKAKADNVVTKYITPYLSFDYDNSPTSRTIQSYDLEYILQKDIKKLLKNIKYEELEIKGPRAGIANTPIEIYLQTNDENKAHAGIEEVKKALKNTKKATNISDNAAFGVDEIKLKLNKYAQELGISEKYLVDTLSGYFLGISLAKGYDKQGIFDIVVKDKDKNMLNALQNFPLHMPNGQIMLLKNLANFVIVKNYEKIYKQNTNRLWLISSELKIGANVNEVLSLIKPTLDKIQNVDKIPIVFGGEEEQNQQLMVQMSIAFCIALFLIFLTLLVMFNSFSLTCMIISVIPFSVLGVFLGHKFMGLELSMPSIIGTLGLAGVVINDGIIMLDFLTKAKNKYQILQKAKLRLRPIFLTSITTLVGLSTLIFFPSGQAVMLQPLAVSLGFGLLWGTFLNLVYLPVLYTLTIKE